MAARSRSFALFAVLVAFSSFPLRAVSPLEKVDLFHAGENGFALYRIPGIVATPKGTVLAYCEARKNSASDWGEIEVHLRRSEDGGRTWDAPRQIAHLGERMPGNPTKKTGGGNEQTVNNPVAIADRKSGAVHFLYCVNYARCFYQRSEDEGATWSPPVDITPAFESFRPEFPWTVLATGPGHGIQMENGRLVVPVWLASGKNGAHRPSVVSVIFSDDAGKTWKRGEIALPNTSEWVNPNETAVAQLADGRVMLNARSESAASRRLVTLSRDGATGWSAPRFDAGLFEPICMGSILRLGTGELVFANPHSLKMGADGREVPGGRGERRNLSIKLSTDEGASWSTNRTLEEGASAYSDLAALSDGTILCFYERGKTLTVARFGVGWVWGK